MPYTDPEVSPSASYRLTVQGPNGSTFTFDQLTVDTPMNEYGQRDPVERDLRFQELLNLIEASPDYAVLWCQKYASMTQDVTPDTQG